ncbi:hypothetical protein PENSTE_c002G00712 [Penicillium steckii]|uniref:GH16 domain-containing protein n=1 Tax=Penicillium steckii TaxID=303698 RepID=A0A1V6TTY1_9EURO|nr:hypothetical protein PENSTE_c002G00712 [Penicillium steckii]
MPFRQALQGIFDKADKAWDEFTNQGPQSAQSSNNPPPPPIPTSSKPPSAYQDQSSQPQIYWRPNLHPQAPVSTNFYHEQGQHGWGNNEAQNYVDSQQNSFHSMQGDAVIVRALINHGHPDPAQKFTSARLSSHQTLDRPRGCLSARIIAPVARGIWPAFWLLPKDPFKWPEDGEIDIMEAWNGDAVNHTCLHWGHFNGEDWDKHRVLETPIPNITSPMGVRYDFIWDEDESTGRGRLVWLIDGRPIMRAEKPPGTRKMSEFRILLNIAVGGNVCQGVMPNDGYYDIVVRELAMWDAPPWGWNHFERIWNDSKDGNTM